MDPRISFSSDFVDAQQAINMKRENIYREAPVSSDFEFCVKNYAMISADEVFSQGMLLPNNKSMTSKKMTTTLRDELLVSDDSYDDVLPRVPKSSSRWKERLGLRKSTSNKDKKSCSTDGFLQRVAENERPSKDNQGLFYGGGQKMC
ncbi:uncharacterized protein LOC129297565 [Prosopis cineraria]|uniref:uncharacterized protein LOC129285373 n=1 Tax=Prosopis cineraria TaxID=364024 RepID=UPI0024109E95|nr:uncharacterized protein LOC129285373 [Prosopis cineraria]XP_054791863.1 uncharacterized protein LOC129297565 [Prosopis cineraria]